MKRFTGQPDRLLIFLVFGIVIFGLVMLSSASTVVGFSQFGDSNYFLKRQLVFGVLVGIGAFLLTSRFPYRLWTRYAVPLMVVTVVLLIAVFIPGIGYSAGGASRWINVGGWFLFQPTEFAKLSFLLYLSLWLDKRGHGIRDFSSGFLPFLTLLAIVCGLILLEPNLSTMTVIAMIALTVLFVAGARLTHLFGFGVLAVGLLILLIVLAPYRAARFTVFLNPEVDPQGIGYHINQAYLAIGSGGPLGLGLGHSRQKYNYLPEVTGDSIFAVIAEELGFFFAVLVLAAFFLLMLRGFRIARGAPDTFGKLVAVGITVWLTFQAFVNIGAMVGLMPLTGIPLPFVSYGSSAMVLSLAAVGILVNISRDNRLSAGRPAAR